MIELFPEDFDEATSSSVGVAQSAPDDLMLLSCSCHFHWYGFFLCFFCIYS